MPSPTIRAPKPDDLPQVAGLLASYMQELFQKPWTGTLERLQQHLAAGHVSLLVAADAADHPIAFAFFRQTYDVHHCVLGAELIDLYVAPPFRGAALGPSLIAAVGREAAKSGGAVFVKGQAASEGTRRLYDRLAVTFPGQEFIVGGRAFRELLRLSQGSWRTALRELPPKSANFEP